jgi:two-component system cell cycle sensor histidine kinase/response regulator CckA
MGGDTAGETRGPAGSEEALRESEERFRGAFRYSPIGMGIVGLDGRFIRVNPALCQIGGYEERELLGLTFQDVVPADELEFHREEVRRLRRGEIESYDHEVRYRHKLGHLVWVRFTVSAIRDRDGEVVHLLGQAEDISARKEAEERLRRAERLEAVGTLAGGVAHEFNNLLAVIGGYARHALGAAGSESMRRDLTEIIGAADRAGEISRQLLAFSRDEDARPSLLDVNGVVSAMEPILRGIVREDRELAVSLEGGLPPVHVDRAQLERVILNLVLNAVDATGEGGRIEIATRAVDLPDGPGSAQQLDGGVYVALSVSDTGRGIKPDALQRLFDPFFTTKAQGKGPGLGLSAVYGIVERFAGSVVVDSEPGEGASFTVHIPAAARRDGREQADGGRPEHERGGTETILVVEDEEPLRTFIEIVLSEAGYRTLTAVDGMDALEQLGRAEPAIDLVLTDSVMPRLSGPELVAQLRETRPGTRVLQVSGYSDHGFGDDDFVPKPFEPELLLRRVREILDRPVRGGPSD